MCILRIYIISQVKYKKETNFHWLLLSLSGSIFQVFTGKTMTSVGPGNLWSGSRSIRARGPCRGGCVSRTNGERPKCRGEQPRTTMSSAIQDFKGKSTVSMMAAPKKSPEGDAGRMRPTWGYGAKLVQGKYVPSALNAPVPSALNAPANVLTMLMRKDA